jgi:hypothetical protein
VNDSAWRANVELGVTMDRLFLEGRFNQLAHAFPSHSRRVMYLRGDRQDRPGARALDAPSIAINESADMSAAWVPRCRLNGMNSGICAINLAFRQKPERVILWGFDMCRSPDGRAYYHEPYPWAPAAATKPGKVCRLGAGVSQDRRAVFESKDRAAQCQPRRARSWGSARSNRKICSHEQNHALPRLLRKPRHAAIASSGIWPKACRPTAARRSI